MSTMLANAVDQQFPLKSTRSIPPICPNHQRTVLVVYTTEVFYILCILIPPFNESIRIQIFLASSSVQFIVKTFIMNGSGNRD